MNFKKTIKLPVLGLALVLPLHLNSAAVPNSQVKTNSPAAQAQKAASTTQSNVSINAMISKIDSILDKPEVGSQKNDLINLRKALDEGKIDRVGLIGLQKKLLSTKNKFLIDLATSIATPFLKSKKDEDEFFKQLAERRKGIKR